MKLWLNQLENVKSLFLGCCFDKLSWFQCSKGTKCRPYLQQDQKKKKNRGLITFQILHREREKKVLKMCITKEQTLILGSRSIHFRQSEKGEDVDENERGYLMSSLWERLYDQCKGVGYIYIHNSEKEWTFFLGHIKYLVIFIPLWFFANSYNL